MTQSGHRRTYTAIEGVAYGTEVLAEVLVRLADQEEKRRERR